MYIISYIYMYINIYITKNIYIYIYLSIPYIGYKLTHPTFHDRSLYIDEQTSTPDGIGFMSSLP